MFGNYAPYKLCFTFSQSIGRDESGSLFAIAYMYLCLTIGLEYVNMRRLMIVRPDNELKQGSMPQTGYFRLKCRDHE
jgi:hypothetical protein